MSKTGYNQLTDAYDTDVYRMARVNGPLAPISTEGRDKGYLVVQFECQPEKYFISTTTYPATVTITDTNAHNFINPSRFTAKPLIEVFGNGVVKIGTSSLTTKYSVTVAGNTNDSLYIDSDAEDCVYSLTGRVSANDKVTFTGTEHKFPLFDGGVTSVVQIVSGVTKVVVTPRWWKL